jgi:hypothetical protein
MDHLLTERIRQAVASGEFQSALLLWNDYVAALQQEVRRGRLSEADMQEAGKLVAWSREVLLCASAHAQDYLNRVNVAGEYTNALAPQTPRIVRVSF